MPEEAEPLYGYPDLHPVASEMSEEAKVEYNQRRNPIQELRLSAKSVKNPALLAKELAGISSLRSLDVAGIGFSDEDIFTILDGNPNLHTIDLTSCRGVKASNRRNIFKVRSRPA